MMCISWDGGEEPLCHCDAPPGFFSCSLQHHAGPYCPLILCARGPTATLQATPPSFVCRLQYSAISTGSLRNAITRDGRLLYGHLAVFRDVHCMCMQLRSRHDLPLTDCPSSVPAVLLGCAACGLGDFSVSSMRSCALSACRSSKQHPAFSDLSSRRGCSDSSLENVDGYDTARRNDFLGISVFLQAASISADITPRLVRHARAR